MKSNALCASAISVALVLMVSSASAVAGSVVAGGFDGMNLDQTINVGGGYIPPDTMGAVGLTQYVQPANGGWAVYDKATGANLQLIGTDVFWNAAGQKNTNGDQRILYNSAANRWVVIGFGADLADINIAVSDTSNALGKWKSSKFTGYPGGIADFPTLAMDKSAIYIGTNNFNAAGTNFDGTTLNVIPLKNVFKADLSAPDATNRGIFNTPYSTVDRGYAIQGVNNNGGTAGAPGKIVADGVSSYGVGYSVLNPDTGAGSSQGPINFLNVQPYTCCFDARQPDGTRNLDTVGGRIGSSAWEQGGKIYFTRSIADTTLGSQVVRTTVLDAATFAVLQEVDIGYSGYDTYMPSLAISPLGVVIGYNRSGYRVADGNIAVYANAYTLDANGLLVYDATHLLKYSANSGYHLGSPNRWGDYSAVSVDPTDSHKFWVIGEYANSSIYTGNGDGWATWIGAVQFVPEPASWAMMITGFAFVGAAVRRRRTTANIYV